MLGFNGGLMGVRRTPTTGTASGLWFQNEQSVAQRAAIWPIVQAMDPDFASVSLLLHLNGSNGSTTFTDSSSNGASITAAGNAQISTTQSKFGGASAYFDGSGDYLQYAAGTTNIGSSQDCTLECWFYRTGGEALFGTTFSGNFQLLTVMSGKLYAYWNGPELEGGIVSDSTWNHAAITRSSGTLRLFLNGTQVASTTGSTANFTVNRFGNTIYRSDWSGYIDEIRLTVGVARYTASFTAPTAPFPDA